MKNILIGLFILISAGLTAQVSFLSPHVPKAADAVGQIQKITPTTATYYSVATPREFGDFLRAIPGEGKPNSGNESLLELPSPDGSVSTFRLTRYQMITNQLQARYPHYVTAFGWDVNAPHRKIYLEWTDLGFAASVTGGAEGRWYVSPQFHQRQDLYQVYYTRDYPARDLGGRCEFESNEEIMAEIAALGPALKSVGDCELREYDLALACTGEYYAAVGGTEGLVVAEMMTAINRVNEVFRSDLAITLKLINLPVDGGGIELVFTNPASDPYTNESGSTMLGENQTTIDNVIGTANYDIGHVFSTGGGGIAALGSPCSSNNKARGVTGLLNPMGDPFYIDFVAHEIGHQFGGNHTFNSFEGNCSQRNAPTAYEPGGGTTIQAYAGICGATADIQMNSDPYYHAISIQEISAYMELGGGSTCASSLSTSNTAPTASAGIDYTIPANTPFVLTATGSDGDGDALTYCWEQFDLGPIVPGIPTGNETLAPLFRSLPPTTSAARYFPNLADLVASGSSQWEVLPRVARTMNFIVTVRDNTAGAVAGTGYGCTVQDLMEVSVVTSSGFAVTAPNGGETWNAGQMETVTWNVAGTGNGTAVDCDMVDIVLSTDGGVTFDQVIATVPNTGTADVTAPTVTETDARIMIRGNGNIFFDVGNADFRIEQTDYDYTVTTGTASVCDGATTADFAFNLESLQGYTGTVNYTGINLPAGAGITFTPASTTLVAGASQAVTFTLSNLGALAPGDYTFQVETDDGSGAKSEDYILSVQPLLAPPTLLTPANGGFLDLNAAVFNWSDVPNATGYEVQVCRDAAGSICFNPNTTTSSSINYGSSFNGAFAEGDQAWWRATALNANCNPVEEATSALFMFTWGTAPPTGASLSNPSGPISICEGSTTNDEFDVNFLNADLTGPATVTITSSPAGLMTTITPGTLDNGQTAIVSFTGEETLAPGSYTITVTADDGTITETLDLTLNVDADAVDIESPVDGEEVLLEVEPACPNGFVSFVNFDFSPYAGPGTAVEYILYVDVVGGGSFPDAVVTPGSNFQGYCVNEGTMLEFRLEAELSDGTFVRSCDRIITATENPLPVDWLSFTARPLGKTSQLDWSVIQDEAHAGFTVERSTSARGGWQDIARIARLGDNGEAAYALNDQDVIVGTTYFYRLRQQDVDGTTDYSQIQSVTFAAETGLMVFPNPVSGQLTVTMGEADLDYQLYDALGKVILKGKLSGGRGLLDLTTLPSAVYQLVVGDGADIREVSRVVKR